MKVGDKILCKKTISSINVDNLYYVINISSDRSNIMVFYGTIDSVFNVLTFSIDKSDILKPYFYDYFYTEQEIRKLKLIKLNGELNLNNDEMKEERKLKLEKINEGR